MIETIGLDEEVIIGNDSHENKICGIITGICVRSGPNVTYEVSWWINGDRKCQWLQQSEIIRSKDTRFKMKIGF